MSSSSLPTGPPKREAPATYADGGIKLYVPTAHHSDAAESGETSCSCGHVHPAPRGHDRFRVAYYEHGARQLKPYKTRSSAEHFIRDLLRRREASLPLTGPAFGSRSVKELCGAYLAPGGHVNDWTDGTEANIRSRLGAWVVPILGDLRCDAWNFNESVRWYQTLKQRGLSEAYIKQVVGTRRELVLAGRRLGYLEPNADPLHSADRTTGLFGPIGKRQRRRGDRRKGVGIDGRISAERIPAVHHLLDMRSALNERAGWSMGFMVWMCAHVGTRLGELLAITLDDLDLEHLTIDICKQWTPALREAPPKYDSYRDTIIPFFLVPELKQQIRIAEKLEAAGLNRDRRLFPAVKGGTMSHNFAEELWLEAAVKLGWHITERPVLDASTGAPLLRADGTPRVRRNLLWGWHAARHFFATWAALPLADGGFGASDGDVSEWLGHASPATYLRTYKHQVSGSHSRARERTADFDPYVATDPRRAG